MNQVYRFGYFHADPHPANLIVLEDDAIGYMDFGIVGKLDEQTTGACDTSPRACLPDTLATLWTSSCAS